MRQVFSSPRLENVEAVARMLEDAGIEVQVVNGRSYRGGLRGNFSYRDNADSGPRPAVWVVRSDQQPAARQLLREAGLLKTSPLADDNFLLPAVQPRGAAIESPWHRGSKFRYGLLLLTAALVGLVFAASRRTAGGGEAAADAAAAAIGTARPAATEAPGVEMGPALSVELPSTPFVLPTPPALATTLFADALVAAEARDAGIAAACLTIDGADAPAAVREALREAGRRVTAAACDDEAATVLAVADYRTNGSGVGVVELRVRRAGTTRTQRFEVQRTGADWRVLRTL